MGEIIAVKYEEGCVVKVNCPLQGPPPYIVHELAVQNKKIALGGIN
jgi:hypothetical protein